VRFVAALVSGLLGGVIGGWLVLEWRAWRMRREWRKVTSSFHVEHAEGIQIPWDNTTAVVTSGWRRMPDA